MDCDFISNKVIRNISSNIFCKNNVQVYGDCMYVYGYINGNCIILFKFECVKGVCYMVV